jgi:hypothetical protein
MSRFRREFERQIELKRTMSISRRVNRGLFGLNSRAAHGRALERGQALLAPAFRAKRDCALARGETRFAMGSGSLASALADAEARLVEGPRLMAAA